MTQPTDSREARERHLRALYRAHAPGSSINRYGKFVLDQAQQLEQWRIVNAEYQRLYGEPTRNGALEEILASTWTEARHMAGEGYCFKLQRWMNAEEAAAIDKG